MWGLEYIKICCIQDLAFQFIFLSFIHLLIYRCISIISMGKIILHHLFLIHPLSPLKQGKGLNQSQSTIWAKQWVRELFYPQVADTFVQIER